MSPTTVQGRFLAASLVSVLLVSLAACSSVSLPNLHERNYRETRTYTQPAGEVFATTRGVLEAMGFEIESSHPAHGDLVGASRVLPGSAAELSRQRRAVVSIKWNSEAMSEVKIGFWESTEEPTPNDTAVSSERLLRGGPIYDSFWMRMQESLPLELPPTPAGTSGAAATGD